MTELSLIIPAYNEAKNLENLLPGLIETCREKNWNLILVNDGSKDETREIIQKMGILFPGFSVIHHKLNKGYGAAIKTGIGACKTEYCVTIDADGQHRLEDVENLFKVIQKSDADLVVGSRQGQKSASFLRGIGKRMIRTLAKILMTVPIYDLNSGMKVYRTELAQKYIHLTPDTMSFSDIITLVFISNRCLVLEEPIKIEERKEGKSTIGMQTAFQTVMEIINIVILFNPFKIFLPIALLCFFVGLGIGLPILLSGHGFSTGSLLGVFGGIIFFLLGLIAEQLSSLRKLR